MTKEHDGGIDTDEDYVVILPEVDYLTVRESVLNIQEQASAIKGIIRACKRLALDEPDDHDRRSSLNPIRKALEVALIEMAALVRNTDQLVRETEPRFNFPKSDRLVPSMGEIAAKLAVIGSGEELGEMERGPIPPGCFDLEGALQLARPVAATRPVTHFHHSKKKH